MPKLYGSGDSLSECPCSTSDGMGGTNYGPHSEELEDYALDSVSLPGLLPPFRPCKNHSKYYEPDGLTWKKVAL